MIKSFRHAGLEKFFKTGSKAGIQPSHAGRLEDQLNALDKATRPEAMNLPGWAWHELKGSRKATWSIKVNGGWRMTFQFEEEDAVLVSYENYH